MFANTKEGIEHLKNRMANAEQVEQTQKVTLFVCSGCDTCDPAVPRFQAWAAERSDVALEIAPVLENPKRIVRFGVSCAPAVVVDGELLVQNVSTDVLIDTLEAWLSEKGLGK